jgi:hypothetical protein
MTQSEIIMKQVALKAAVELTKDKFDQLLETYQTIFLII